MEGSEITLMDDVNPYQNVLTPRRRNHERKKKKDDTPGVAVGMENCSKCRYHVDTYTDYSKMRCTNTSCNPLFDEDLKTWLCYCFAETIG